MITAKKMEKTIQTSKYHIVYLLAFILILTSAYDIYKVYEAAYVDTWGLLDDIYSAVIKIIMAEFILFDPKKNVWRAIGFYAMSIGLTRLISSYSMISSIDPTSLAFGLITLLMGVNILISGYRYMNDTTRGRVGMMASTWMLLTLQLVILVMYFQTWKLMGSIEMSNIAQSVILMIQYITLIIIMDTDEIRYNTITEKVSTRLQSAMMASNVERKFELDRKNAYVLKHMFDDKSSWNQITNDGPIESEKRLTIKDGRVQTNMILQKWKDSENIHVTMVNDGSGTIVAATRFSVSDIICDSEDDDSFRSIRLFDGNKIQMQLSVLEKPPEKKRRGAA